MKKPLMIFALLQLLDIATTLIALALGGAEQNPLVGHMMLTGTVTGLILSKLIVVGLAVAFILIGRGRVIRWANVAFSLIVVWNVTIICRLALLA
jgi:Domain of unknown function (DUF5658)